MIINRIQVLKYGCLRYVDVPMDRFHVLIGPNASGKSTLMDAIKFVSDVVRDGVSAACEKRTANFADLVWGRPDAPEEQRFEIALEFGVPTELQLLLPPKYKYNVLRYGIAVGINDETGRVSILSERSTLLEPRTNPIRAIPVFPQPLPPDQTIIKRFPWGTGFRNLFHRDPNGRTAFYYETLEEKERAQWATSLNLGANLSALSVLPDLPDAGANSPMLARVAAYLRDEVISLSLVNEKIRRASPPGNGSDVLHDGSNMPWIADALKERAPERWRDWIGHIQCALEGFQSVRVIDRPEDRHKYLILEYSNGLEVPSWKTSDGTLRLLALTLLAYMPRQAGLYMIEEPENGIHPGTLQDVFDSLSSVYEAQVLLATHSPEFVAIADVKHILCFGRNPEGAIDIIPGELHPHLRDWQYETDLGTFFASNILA